MRRTILRLLLVFGWLAGGAGELRPAAAQDAAAGQHKSADDAAKKLAEGLAKPLQEMAKSFVQSNPGFLEAMYKQKRITPLHLAAWDNKTAEARKLLAAGADVSARDADGSTPLHYAAYAFGGDIIPVLVAAGADVNAKDKDGCTPLHVAMVVGGHGGEKAIPYLLQAKANINALDDGGCTPLVRGCAANSPDLDKIKVLLAARPNVNLRPKNGWSALHWACGVDEELVGILIAAGANVNAPTDDGTTPLHYAARLGRLKIVQSLLKAKADPGLRDKNGWSPTAVAADSQMMDVVAALRDAGAKEPSWTNLHRAAIGESPGKLSELLKDKKDVNVADAYGRTPLYWALRCNEAKAADLLIAAGADVTKIDKHHKSILQVAAWADRPDIVRKAVAAGADVRAADDDGYTALHRAAVAENAEIVRFLLEKGANVNAVTASGDTPLLLAFHARNPELLKNLLAAGADVLAVNDEGKSIETDLWKVFDKPMETLLRQAVQEATQARIDRICRLYSSDNPRALKAGDVQPLTPSMAAVRMYRALFGPDKETFTSMFVGNKHDTAIIGNLYDATRDYIAFRKALKAAYGADAIRRFDDLKVDNVHWTFTLIFIEEDRFQKMKVEVRDNQAVCHRFPSLEECGDVHFVKLGNAWRIDPAFLAPAIQPEANLRFFSGAAHAFKKGRELLDGPKIAMEELKRAMWDEYNWGTDAATAPRDFDKDLADASERIRRNPKDATAYALRGEVRRQREAYRNRNAPQKIRDKKNGELRKAVADFQEAVRLQPDYLPAYNGLGFVYSTWDDSEGALAAFAKAIEVGEKSAGTVQRDLAIAYNRRGLIHARKGDAAAAEFDFGEAIRLRADYADPRDNRAFVLSHRGQLNKAVTDLSEAIRLQPRFAPRYAFRAGCYADLREPDKAIADYGEAIRLGLDNPAVRVGRAIAYNANGQYDKASADYEQALQLNPSNAEVLNSVAWFQATCPEAKYRDGKLACQNANKANELSGGKSWQVWDTLAAACAERGDFAKAREWETKAIEAAANDKSAAAKYLPNFHSRLELYKQGKPYQSGRLVK